MGALFNFLSAAKLRTVTFGQFATSDLLDHRRLEDLQKSHPDLLQAAQSTIAHGLLWVFVAMLLAAAVQLLFSRFIRAHRHHQPVTTTEALASVGE